jgi:HD-GYP domain-containing protein (c-di-GMP phosphodiesterase class II)
MNSKHSKELIARFSRAENFLREKAALKEILHNPTWCIFPSGVGFNGFKKIKKNIRKPHRKRYQQSISCLWRQFKKCKSSKNCEVGVCPDGLYCFSIPLREGNDLLGVIIVSGLDARPTKKLLNLVKVFSETVFDKVRDELELSNLHQSLHPRAVALSTIHTVRRLISSSLNLNELLPRLSRLCLQVLRAKRCVISLVDPQTGKLQPQSTIIDLRKDRVPSSAIKSIRRIENRAIRQEKAIFTANCLSMPLVDEDLMGVITVSRKMRRRKFDKFDREILTVLSEQAVVAIKNARLYQEQQNMIWGSIKSISRLLKTKSPHTFRHSPAFMHLVTALGREMKLSEQNLTNLHYATLLHDVGEVGIPEQILKKPGGLTGEEINIIKKHPRRTAEIFSPMEVLKPIMPIIVHHHECYDGSGYPDHLKGDKIPIGARIMAVADAFEAMISQRPYRKVASIESAIQEIKRGSGVQFDPKVVSAFLNLVRTKNLQAFFKNAQPT